MIWAIGLAGISLRLILKGRLHGLVVALYIAMGWAAVVAIQPMLKHVGLGGLLLLAGGGPGLHGGGGLLQMAAAALQPRHLARFRPGRPVALHFFAVLFYVIPWPVQAG